VPDEIPPHELVYGTVMLLKGNILPAGGRGGWFMFRVYNLHCWAGRWKTLQ